MSTTNAETSNQQAADNAACIRRPPVISERGVAELAASGMTNREIAQILFVTIKAVQWHLGHTYRKLNISGRADLQTALNPHPPNPTQG